MTEDEILDDIFELNAYDYYDYDAMEKLQESRTRKHMKIMKQFIIAKKKGDEKAMEKAVAAMSKHRSQDEILKVKCSNSGYYWY